MQVIESLVFPGRGYNYPQMLIIHETANPGATALNHVVYWSSGRQNGEAHYVTDWTGKVYHTTRDDRACWHVGGNANSFTVGIELCHATNQADFEKVWQTGVEFAAWYLESRGWGIEKMTSHRIANEIWETYSDHTDPDGYFAEFGKSWAQFVQEVNERLESEVVTPQDKQEIAQDVWGYNWKGTARQNNMYDVVNALYDMVQRIEKRLDVIEKKIK